MAIFVGSKIQDDNWGEDYLVKKLIEYFDDSYVIYRNRSIFGAQFDVCMLAPQIGVVIFEVKSWKKESIKYIKNGDAIVIDVKNEDTGEYEEKEENPTAQARGYVYKMRRKIRQKTGKIPLVYEMVCLPNLTKSDFDKLGIESVCEYESTILKEDLENKNTLFRKMNLCIKNHKGRLEHSNEFTDELMFRVRQIFETDIKLDDKNVENTDFIEGGKLPDKQAYSLLAYIPKNYDSKEIITSLIKDFSVGTKLYVAVEDIDDLVTIRDKIFDELEQKGLMADGLDLKIDFAGIGNNRKDIKDSFIVFNCSVFLVPARATDKKYICIKDGNVQNQFEKEIIKYIDKNSTFNAQQYRIEHSDLQKNIIVKAGAGTGKTFTMISRMAFICHKQNCAMKEMANRVVMITFTDDAANQMEEKIKQHFNNYYLLTGDADCLSFINQIEGMQISTIHSYARKIISLLGFEYGYGNEVTVASGDYRRKQIIASEVDKYIVQKRKKYGDDYLKRLRIPVYLINKHIFNLLERLHNQSVDVASLTKVNFGYPINENNEFHELLVTIIPQVEKEYEKVLKADNKIHLNNMMSILKSCIKNNMNVERLLKMQTGRPQFMFVDEFQDTDDVQIEALYSIAKLLQYKLFVVGDVKQCIYRFRGAKENAFDQLGYKNDVEWKEYSLYKNYRTDIKLLDLFHNSFEYMGNHIVDGEPLLIYNENREKEDEQSDRLKGTKVLNDGLHRNDFYRKISISSENMRISAIFDEVHRCVNLLNSRKEGLSRKEKEIAILVRENWQAETIKKAGKILGYDVLTNTGGDLYMSEPALDMLTLANALLHYDESDYLYALVSSNFIGGGMSKARMYSIRTSERNTGWKKTKALDTTQSKDLQKHINSALSVADDIEWRDWNSVVHALRMMPVLQVLRKLYYILKPWIRYGENCKTKQDNYRLNVDLLFEEIINTANTDSLTINSLVDILNANIISNKNVDSRMPENKEDDIVIKCVTIHKSKGLEYGCVILPYCSFSINTMKRVDMNVSITCNETTEIGYQIKYAGDVRKDLFQNSYFNEGIEKSERMKEETRVLYVAMTRAIRSFSWIALDNKENECWQNLIWEEE